MTKKNYTLEFIVCDMFIYKKIIAKETKDTFLYTCISYIYQSFAHDMI